MLFIIHRVFVDPLTMFFILLDETFVCYGGVCWPIDHTVYAAGGIC